MPASTNPSATARELATIRCAVPYAARCRTRSTRDRSKSYPRWLPMRTGTRASAAPASPNRLPERVAVWTTAMRIVWHQRANALRCRTVAGLWKLRTGNSVTVA